MNLFEKILTSLIYILKRLKKLNSYKDSKKYNIKRLFATGKYRGLSSGNNGRHVHDRFEIGVFSSPGVAFTPRALICGLFWIIFFLHPLDISIPVVNFRQIKIIARKALDRTQNGAFQCIKIIKIL